MRRGRLKRATSRCKLFLSLDVFSIRHLPDAAAMKATATGIGRNNTVVIALPKAAPSTAAGMKAMAMLMMNRCARGSVSAPLSKALNLAGYSQTIASIAPL